MEPIGSMVWWEFDVQFDVSLDLTITYTLYSSGYDYLAAVTLTLLSDR